MTDEHRQPLEELRDFCRDQAAYAFREAVDCRRSGDAQRADDHDRDVRDWGRRAAALDAVLAELVVAD